MGATPLPYPPNACVRVSQHVNYMHLCTQLSSPIVDDIYREITGFYANNPLSSNKIIITWKIYDFQFFNFIIKKFKY